MRALSATDPFAHDLLDRLPLGVAVYRLEDSADPRSLRLLYVNGVSGEITRVDLGAEVGRRLVEIAPEVEATGLLEAYAEVARSGEPRDLGQITYGDDRIAEATYHVRALPLADHHIGVVFENVSDRAEVAALRETQAELARKEARYRSLVEATAAVVWTTSPEGGLLADLDRWHALTGQPPEEAAGAGWVEAVHPDDRAAAAEAWRRAVETESLYLTQYRLRHADGTYRHVEARGVPVRDAAGDIAEWVGVNTDVEAQVQAAARLAESEAQLRTLLDGIADAVLVYPIGLDGPEPFSFVNQAALDLYGYTREEMATLTVDDIVDPGRVDVGAALAELRRERRATFDSTHLAKDGRRLPMSTSARLVEVDGRLSVVALARDDSDRRAFRRALAEENQSLERAVATRTSELEAFAEDLKILHKITTAADVTETDRLTSYLQAGCRIFELPAGILSSTPVDAETGETLYRIESVVSPSPALRPGLTMALGDTFCDAVVAASETVAYADAEAEPEASTNPACRERGLRAFIGTPVYVDGALFGTLNFSSTEPRDRPFAPYERDLIEVMAQAVGRQLQLDRIASDRDRSAGWYRSVVDTLQEALVLVDPEGRVLQANPAAQTLLGVGPGGPLRRAGHDVLGEDGAPVPAAALPEREAFATGRPVRARVLGVPQADHAPRWYSVNATPVDETGDGLADFVVLTFNDVTERREQAEAARRSEALLQAVQDAALDGVMAFRAVRAEGGEIVDFEWTQVNAAAAALVDRSAEDLVGARMLEVYPGNREAGLFDAYVRVVETGEPLRTTVEYPHDGLDTVYRVRATPLEADPDGVRPGFVVTFEDLATSEVRAA